jgi:hypothetical protein
MDEPTIWFWLFIGLIILEHRGLQDSTPKLLQQGWVSRCGVLKLDKAKFVQRRNLLLNVSANLSSSAFWSICAVRDFLPRLVPTAETLHATNDKSMELDPLYLPVQHCTYCFLEK